MYLVENQFINIRCKQCNEYFKKMNVSLPSVLVINREVCDASFENIKKSITGDQTNDHFNYLISYSKTEGYNRKFP